MTVISILACWTCNARATILRSAFARDDCPLEQRLHDIHPMLSLQLRSLYLSEGGRDTPVPGTEKGDVIMDSKSPVNLIKEICLNTMTHSSDDVGIYTNISVVVVDGLWC